MGFAHLHFSGRASEGEETVMLRESQTWHGYPLVMTDSLLFKMAILYIYIYLYLNIYLYIYTPMCSMVLEYESQHLPHKSPSFVGKYTSTMVHLGLVMTDNLRT